MEYPLIRKAKPEEWQKVVDIYKRENLNKDVDLVERETKKEFPEIGTNRIIWFAEVNGLIIGVIQLVFLQGDLANGKDSAMIHHLRVSKNFEGKGIGSQLIKTVEEEAVRRDIKILNLEVDRNNRRARMIYEHLGYNYSKDGTDPSEIILTKYLFH